MYCFFVIIVFLKNKIPEEKTHYSCIAATSVSSVLKLNEENYHQVYLKQGKYRQKSKKTTVLIGYELEHSIDEELKM